MLGAMCELFVAVGLGCARAGETRTPRRLWQRGGRADLRFVYGAVAIALWQRGRSVARPEQVAPTVCWEQGSERHCLCRSVRTV